MSRSSAPKADVLIAFGANQGQCQAAFEKAIECLQQDEKVIELRFSQPVQTIAVLGDTVSFVDEKNPSRSGSNARNEYLNAAIRLLTTHTPQSLHATLIQIEMTLGRERIERWGPRTIDLDLLLFNDLQIDTQSLTIPHPRMSFRRFVLQPALEIAAEMVHPVSGMTIQQLENHLSRSGMSILFVTDDAEFARQCVSKAPATIEIVNDTDTFMKWFAKARLVVSRFGESNGQAETRSLQRYAQNFAGPTLKLCGDIGLEQARTEVFAAIEAMQQ